VFGADKVKLVSTLPAPPLLLSMQHYFYSCLLSVRLLDYNPWWLVSYGWVLIEEIPYLHSSIGSVLQNNYDNGPDWDNQKLFKLFEVYVLILYMVLMYMVFK